MKIEERLDRLTERHEALTLSVEILTQDVRDLTLLVKDIAVGTARLLHAIEGHEQRISDFEEGNRPK